MSTFKDQSGRIFSLEASPKRIISLVPSQTELLFDLGLEDEIVGISKFCVHPYHFKSTKKSVGGTKKVDYQKIKELLPDFILCNKEENTKEMVSELEKIAPTYVSDVKTIDHSMALIESLGIMLNRRTEAKNLIQKIQFKLSDFKAFIKDIPSRKVAYFIWTNPWMVAGGDNFINEMLQLNKFENIYANKGRYPEVDISKIRFEGDPKIVFLSSEPYPFTDEHAFEIASYSNRSMTVFADGELFSWFGSRMLFAFEYFKELHKRLDSEF